VSDEVRERVAAYSAQFPRVLATIPGRYHDMPYRVLFRLIAARLEATRRDAQPPEGYAASVELERDLGLVIASLRTHRGEHADCSVCSACCAASRHSASTWPRSTCDSTHMSIARCSRRC